jgi:hypothetical protein
MTLAAEFWAVWRHDFVSRTLARQRITGCRPIERGGKMRRIQILRKDSIA